jgi:hypothetical protein
MDYVTYIVFIQNFLVTFRRRQAFEFASPLYLLYELDSTGGIAKEGSAGKAGPRAEEDG